METKKKKIGFIDWFIDEFHANCYVKRFRESALGAGFEVAMTSGITSPSGKNKQRTRIISEKNEPASWPTQMAYVVRQTRNNAPYSPNLDDGIDTLAVVLAAYESGHTGKRVEIRSGK